MSHITFTARQRVAACFAAAAVAAAVIGLLLSTGGGGAQATLARPAGVAVKPRSFSAAKSHVTPKRTKSASEIFAVLRKAQTSDAARNPALVKFAANDPSLGLRIEEARKLMDTPTGTLWLVPADGWVCLNLAAPDGTSGGNCDRLANVAEHGIVMSQDGQYYGTMPDGTGPVSVNSPGSSPGFASINANGAFTLPAGQYLLTFKSPQGPQRLDLAH